MTIDELQKENEQLKEKLQKTGVKLLVDGYNNDEDTLRELSVELLGVRPYLTELLDRDYEFSRFDRQLIWQIL